MFADNDSITNYLNHENIYAANYTTKCMTDVALFIKYAGTSIVILGLIGNFLSILVFSRKSLRSRSCSTYFLALSMSDVNVLIGYTLENLLLHGYGVQVLSNFFSCKAVIFLIYASTDISNYLLTLAAVDRCVLVSDLTSRYRFCHKSIAKLLITVVVLLFSFINSHILFGFDIDDNGACLPISDNYIRFYTDHYDSYIDIIKTVLIPFILLCFCNAFIIFKLSIRRHSLMKHATFRRRSRSRRRREKDRQLTWFLLSTSILFILLSLPSEINDFIRTHLKPDFQIMYSCQLWASTSVLILFQHMNHASHFYVYTLTGPVFRKEFQKLFCLNRTPTSSKVQANRYQQRSSITHYTNQSDPLDRSVPNMFKQFNSLPLVSFKYDAQTLK
jgi:hypothetical protein